MGRDVLDVEAKSLSAGPQQFDIAFTPCAKAVVMSHDNGGGAESLDQHVTNKLFGLESRESAVEGLDDQMVEPRLRQTCCTLVHGLDQLEATGIAKKYLSRMGVKSEYRGFGLFLFAFEDHPVEQCPMPQMHAIKGAGGHNAPLSGRKVGESSVNVHCC